MVGLATRATLRGLRLLAHQPRVLPAPGGTAADCSLRGLRLVPLGRRAMGFQPADSAGADLTAGLLGAPRIRVWTVFHPAQASAGYSYGVHRLAHNLSGHALAIVGAHPAQGKRDAGPGMVSRPGESGLRITKR